MRGNTPYAIAFLERAPAADSLYEVFRLILKDTISRLALFLKRSTDRHSERITFAISPRRISLGKREGFIGFTCPSHRRHLCFSKPDILSNLTVSRTVLFSTLSFHFLEFYIRYGRFTTSK